MTVGLNTRALVWYLKANTFSFVTASDETRQPIRDRQRVALGGNVKASWRYRAGLCMASRVSLARSLKFPVG